MFSFKVSGNVNCFRLKGVGMLTFYFKGSRNVDCLV